MSSNPVLGIHVAENLPDGNLQPLLIDLKGLVKLTTLGLRTLRRLDAAGDIPARVVVGRRVLFQLDVIKEWVRAGLPDKDRWSALQKFNRRSR